MRRIDFPTDEVPFGMPLVPAGWTHLDAPRQGSWGYVTKARYTKTGAVWAVKRPKSLDIESAARFNREVAALRELVGCPYVLQLPTAADDIEHVEGFLRDRAAFVVFEWADESLADHCRAKHLAPLVHVARWVLQAATALDYMHVGQLAHRDIKPSNLLLVGEDVRIGDFGLARRPHHDSLTDGREPMGTLAYLDPDSRDDPERGDRYALALTAYQLLTGGGPFGPPGERLSRGDWEARHRFGRRILPSQLNSALGPRTDRVFARALAAAPSSMTRRWLRRPWMRRYATAVEFALALGDALVLDTAHRADRAISEMPVFDKFRQSDGQVVSLLRPNRFYRSCLLAGQWHAIKTSVKQPQTSARTRPPARIPPAHGWRRPVLAGGVAALVGAGAAGLTFGLTHDGTRTPNTTPPVSAPPAVESADGQPTPGSGSQDATPASAEDRERLKAQRSSDIIVARLKAEHSYVNNIWEQMFSYYTQTNKFREVKKTVDAQFAHALVDAHRVGISQRSKDARERAETFRLRAKRQRLAWQSAWYGSRLPSFWTYGKAIRKETAR
jgi:serine/threonine protein kinase